MSTNTQLPLVSICCLTYNHVKYIEKCLDSLINQKTNFNYEILINDDGSHDGTVKILKKYELKYSRKITCIYQKINQSKRGENNLIDVLYNLTKGKYIAHCDGDDFWISKYKLQQQIDFLEQNKEYSLVGSRARLVDFNNKKIGEYPILKEKDKLRINIDSFLEYPYNIFPHSSLVFKKSDFFIDFDIYKYPIGDLPIIFSMLFKNDAYLIDENLVAWRIHDRSSWTSLDKEKNVKKSILAYKLIFNDFDIKKDAINSILKYYYYQLSLLYAVKKKIIFSLYFWFKSLNDNSLLINKSPLKRLKYIFWHLKGN